MVIFFFLQLSTISQTSDDSFYELPLEEKDKYLGVNLITSIDTNTRRNARRDANSSFYNKLCNSSNMQFK